MRASNRGLLRSDASGCVGVVSSRSITFNPAEQMAHCRLSRDRRPRCLVARDRLVPCRWARHFAAYEHLASGTTPDELQALLGWSSPASADPYIHVSDDRRRAAVDRLTDRLASRAHS